MPQGSEGTSKIATAVAIVKSHEIEDAGGVGAHDIRIVLRIEPIVDSSIRECEIALSAEPPEDIA